MMRCIVYDEDDVQCPNKAHAHKLCKKHYECVRRHGDPFTTTRIHGDDIARLASQLAPPNEEGCALFTGSLDRKGYGQFQARGASRKAHVEAWEQANGRTVRLGYHVGHLCHDAAAARGECDGGVDCPHRLCCTPEHLAEQTPRENALGSPHTIASQNAAKECCPNCGGEYTVGRPGERICRSCSARRAREWRARRKLQP